MAEEIEELEAGADGRTSGTAATGTGIDLALAKFEEADKYASNWGRLHLKWGDALYYAGKKDEAAAQLAQAAGLDLTPSEKAELAGTNHG